MFLFVQAFGLSVLAVYSIIWMMSSSVEAEIAGVQLTSETVMNLQDPLAIKAIYKVNGKYYTEQFPRDHIPFTQKTIRIRYLNFAPTVTRIDDFSGVWLTPILFYLFWLFVTGILLLTHNTVFSRHTVFETYNRYPWISMSEYFPYHDSKDEGFFRFRFYRNRPKKTVPKKISDS